MLRWTGIVLAAMLWLPHASQSSALDSNRITAQAQAGTDLPVIAVAELTAEARATLDAIKHGGPFAFEHDGRVFNNFEGILPKRRHGYYHEYTVATPGVDSRGVRRIVSGTRREYYYTADHYQTFKRIVE